MHVLFREAHGLEEAETPVDLGQDPSDLVFLSFSDSDLGAFAAGWHLAAGTLPALRIASLAALRHPLSVDTYLARTLSRARGILIRLNGGESYWPYGLAQVQDLAARSGIALAVLPGDARPDARLDAASTVPVPVLRRLSRLCQSGGAIAAKAALAELARAAGLEGGADFAGSEPPEMPEFGWYDPLDGAIASPPAGGPLAVVAFYRSYLAAGDTGPVDGLIAALRARGFAATGLFAPSLKAEAAAQWTARELARIAPAIIINLTAFSARNQQGVSPLDAAGCPVFQVALSTARQSEWALSTRGLSPADLAMHVVLPEVDGRIVAGVVSFKSEGVRDPDLQFSRVVHAADPSGIAAVADRVAAWHRLRTTPAQALKPALVLSTYPGKAHQMAHAVGLDVLASTEAILADLAGEGYAVDTVSQGELVEALQHEKIEWPVSAYLAELGKLPQRLQAELRESWGDPGQEAFRFAALRRGAALIALQPERGAHEARDTEYHDLARVPCHDYVAFYLWLCAQGVDVLVHVGTHGTLEWLPGKAVALSEACWPRTLLRALPVIYPFIVNDPGEAAQARRRLGAVTLGHLPPPLIASSLPQGLVHLEALLDEFSTADGLDPARRTRLVAAIRAEARSGGIEQDLGLPENASPAEALAAIDRFVCDIKESQFGDGLHVFGRGACGDAERTGLLAALAGLRVASGPAGSPYRGRTDVLPTGRNLYAVDPRSVPSRAAQAQGVRLAEELLRRHLQDHGEWPRALVVDLWGSATMRTAGEEFAMALHLAGLAPLRDAGSERVTGFEVLPLALLDRPRIDVTLRVSGLFRDMFPGLAQMFEAACTALADRRDEAEFNPYALDASDRGPSRVFGPAPGTYGLAMGQSLDVYGDESRGQAAEAWLQGSSFAIDAAGNSVAARAALEARVCAADSFVHVQDLTETDLLLASDYAAHQGGFAAAAAHLGSPPPRLYHLDTTRPEAPRARRLPEEIARVMRARAGNPAWADGMMRHGFRGAAEIAATLDHLGAFAHLTNDIPAHLFDLYHDATLGRDDVVAFMARENPLALAALRERFAALRAAGLWITRRNSIAATLGRTS